MESAVKSPLAGRVNYRMLLFLAVVLVPLGFIFSIFFSEIFSGGVHDRGDYLEVELKQMSTFEMSQSDATDGDVPAKWRELDGKRVQLVGEMYAPDSAGDRLREFDLVYSIAQCCVTPTPKIQHFVKSRGVDGRPVPYYAGLVQVTGILHVGIQRNGPRITSVFRLDVEKVAPVG